MITLSICIKFNSEEQSGFELVLKGSKIENGNGEMSSCLSNLLSVSNQSQTSARSSPLHMREARVYLQDD